MLIDDSALLISLRSPALYNCAYLVYNASFATVTMFESALIKFNVASDGTYVTTA